MRRGSFYSRILGLENEDIIDQAQIDAINSQITTINSNISDMNSRQIISLTNKTGSSSVKGSVVSASDTTDLAFKLQSNEYDAIGIVLESGIADGQECKIVISGKAQVLLKDSTASARGQVLFSADTDGRAIASDIPTPPNADSHFKEIGHCIESKGTGTNVLCWGVIHFN